MRDITVVEEVNTYGVEHVQKLTVSDGNAVSLSADKSILAVGAIRDDDGSSDTGSVYIYKQT